MTKLFKILATSAITAASLLLLSATAYAANYYVAPNGSDISAGTIDAPFKSIMQAQSAASSGDTVYLRGGTYDNFTIAATDSTFNFVHKLDKSGISYEAYANEKPVFNFSSVPTNKRVCPFYIPDGTTGINFRGFDVTGVKVGTQKQSETFRVRGEANFDRVTCHDNEAIGFYYTGKGYGTAINCDAYNNIGPTSASVGNCDGFGAHSYSTNTVTFKYCRSWHNSDDGYDCISSTGPVVFDHCWAYDMTAGGDSNGFKVGGGNWGGKLPEVVPVHTVRFCLSAENNSNGFYANHQLGQAAVWTYNTAYNNKESNFNMTERTELLDLHSDIPGKKEVLHNNIAYMGVDITMANLLPQNETNNSWTRDEVTVSEEDFQSLDASQMTLPRKADGSLPDITFMRLVDGSDLSGLGNFWHDDKENGKVYKDSENN